MKLRNIILIAVTTALTTTSLAEARDWRKDARQERRIERAAKSDELTYADAEKLSLGEARALKRKLEYRLEHGNLSGVKRAKLMREIKVLERRIDRIKHDERHLR